MNILIIHNFYQIAGGEDAVYQNEITMLRKFGHTVDTFTVHNDAINSLWGKIRALSGIVFSISSYFKMKQNIKVFKPDIVHVHNYFPLLSPAIFYACKSMGVPVVHTLHNFRAICPTAFLMHKNKVTEKSINDGPWWTIKQQVYKGSIIGSLAVSLMVALHRSIGTWDHKVDGFICLTEFAKNIYVKAGWPASKLFVKPNFIATPFITNESATPNKYAVFVGRLCQEKGIELLIGAWKNIDFPLYIIGDGPERHIIENCKLKHVHYLGPQPKDKVLNYVKSSSFLVMTSTWYEGLPMVLIEAFACGTCAIVPNIGGMAEVVTDKTTGLHFEAGNESSLTECVNSIIKTPEIFEKYGTNAKDIYNNKYSEETNYQTLNDIYVKIIKNNKACSNETND
jgi:glycosyltransferase involved in cell wall biosynthesis